MKESNISEGFMNSNSKILSAIAIVLALVILGSEVWERRASSETLLGPNSPQINITPNEKPAPDVVPDEAIPDESPEVKPEPINPQQPKRRFVIPRSSPRREGISGGCSPGGCSPGGEIIYYEGSSCSPSYGRCR